MKIEKSSNEEKSTQDLTKILERIEKLEQENKELREKDIPNVVKWREHYKWPRTYSYKLWWWVPVLDYISEKKDKTRDFVYKNIHWEFTENQLLVLKLANWKEEKVLCTSFNDWFERSDKLECKVESNWSEITGFIFTTKEFGEFKVSPKCIN